MEYLTKHQLILLALLISFVTSLATGIVTVSLMAQAPQSVTRTINQIVEKTIQSVSTQDAAVGNAVVVNHDQTAEAVTEIMQSVVKIGSASKNSTDGVGLIVSNRGVIIADKSTVSNVSDPEAILPDGRRILVSIILSQTNGDLVFLSPTSFSAMEYTPIHFASSTKLGQTVLSLSGTSTPVLGQGIVLEINTTNINPDGSQPAYTSTNISSSKVTSGSPLFDLNGGVIGISTKTLSNSSIASFYPVGQLSDLIKGLK